MLKRVISLILSLVMFFSVMPVSVWATEENPAAQDETRHDHSTEDIPETTGVTEPVTESTPEITQTEEKTISETTGETVETITEVHISFADPVPGEMIPTETVFTVTTVPEEAQNRVVLKGQWYVSYGDDSTYALAPEGVFQPGANYALALTVEAAEGTTEETVWMVNDSVWQDMNIPVRDESGAVQNVGVCCVYMLPRSQQTYLADSATYWDGTTATAFAGGSGTSSNPYQIATCGQLNFLATLLKSETSSNYTTYGKAYYKLTANLNMSSRNFTGIPYFGGVFDGNGYTISGLYITSSQSTDLGLFCHCTKATIKNLTVKGVVSHSSTGSTGGIAGEAYDTTITDCKNYCRVSGSSAVGGIVGFIGYESSKASVKNCINYGLVDGRSSYIGGIAGYVSDWHSSRVTSTYVTVSYCGNTAPVYGYYEVGGIVGKAYGGGISYCGNAGNITATKNSNSSYDNVRLGGIVGSLDLEEDYDSSDGYNSGYSYASVKNCYNTGTITGGSGTSGVVGYMLYGSVAPDISNLYNVGKVNCTYPTYPSYYEVTSYSSGKNMFYLQNVNPGANKGTAAVMSDSQMQIASNFNGFSFSSSYWGWASTGTYKYPIIASLGVLTPVSCPHSYTGYISNNDATCTEYGTKTTRCKYNCGAEDTVTDTSIEPGHIWDEGKITKKPNVLDAGEMTYTCTRCSETKTEDLPAGVVAEGITCTLEDGVLIISGEGPMPDYSYTITSTSANQPWAPYADQITKVIVEDGITAIGSSSFNGMSNLKTAELADSVGEIGWAAFKSCTALSQVNIPAGVTEVNNNAFENCESLTSMRIPKGVTLLEPSAFSGCKNLMLIWVDAANTVYASNEEGVVFSKDMKTLVFLPSGRTGTYTVPSGVTTIGSYACSYSKGVKKVILPDTLTTLADHAFSSCSNLQEAALPQTVTSIGIGAFFGCSSLKKMEIPSGVKSIGSETFRGAAAMTSVVLPEGLTAIGANAFRGCKNLGTLTLPETLKTIGEYAFADCDILTEITIPANVKSIPKYLFYYCDALKRVNILGSGVSVTNYAFTTAGALEEVRLYGTRGTFSTNSFSGITATVWYPAGDGTWTGYTGNNYGGTLTWKKHCVGEHKQVINTAVPPTCLDSGLTEGISCSVCDVVTKVQEVVPASGHTAIAVAEKPATCTQFGISAGTKCSACGQVLSGMEVILSNGHTEVIDEAVDATCTSDGKTQGKHCSACGEVLEEQEVIPAGHNVENGICTKCEKYGTCGQNLTWNLDGNGVLTISGSGAMYYDSEGNAPWYDSRDAVKTVIIGDEVTRIARGAFLDCSNLSEVTIGESVEEIEDIAFRNCTGLNSVEIPESVVTIGSYVFDGCTGLSKITVPDSVTRMGTGVFANCSALEEVAFEGNAPTHTYGDAVFNLFGDITVKAYYPAGNDTWTETVRQNYGGTVTWIPVCADGHTEVVDEAVKATCTADGKTEGRHCSACGMVLVKQEVIPGGHTVENGICTRCEKYGTCGDNLTWTYANGTLTISGEGEMDDYNFYNLAPWHTYQNSIKTAIIENGVTSIGECVFACYTSLTSVEIPDSVISIGEYAFGSCIGLTSVEIGNSVTHIGNYAFCECTGLTSVKIGNSVTHIGNWAFNQCTNLTSVEMPASVASIGNNGFTSCTNLKEIVFKGDALSFGNNVFYYVTATAYYPANNKTWTEEVRQDYGGTIAWVGYRDDVATVNGVNYGSLEKALAAAQDGDVVELQKDTAEELVTVREGITLDLKGHTLTAEYFVTFNGAQTIDSSEKNTGLLKIDSNRVMISNDNTQLPVWNGEGYVFTPVKFLQAMPSCDRNGFSYVFLPRFKTGATNLLKDGVEGNKVTIEVRISWRTAQGRENRTVVYNDRYISAAITDGGALTISCGGLSKMKAEGGISIESIVISDTGVIAASAPIVVDVSKIAPNEPLQIVKEAHALAGNTELPYNPVTLTGKIDLVNTPWNEQNQNITVTMYIADDTNREYPVTCYCMVSSGEELDECIQTLTQGDQITVKGKLMKYQDNRTGTTRVEFECPELIGYTPATNG